MLICLIILILGTVIGTLVIKYSSHKDFIDDLIPEYSWQESFIRGTIVGIILFEMFLYGYIFIYSSIR